MPLAAQRTLLTLWGQHMVELSPDIIPAGPVIHHHGGVVGLKSSTHTVSLHLLIVISDGYK